MGFWKIFTEVPKWFWNQLVGTWKTEEANTLSKIKELAMPIIETVSKVDVDGDGKVSNIKEVLDIAEKYGAVWGKKLLANGRADAEKRLESYFGHDLQKYIAMAKLTVSIANTLGIDKLLPKSRMFGGLIEVALNQLLDKEEKKK